MVMLESWHRVTCNICLVGPAHPHSPAHAFIGREQSLSSGYARKLAQGSTIEVFWSVPSLIEYKVVEVAMLES